MKPDKVIKLMNKGKDTRRRISVFFPALIILALSWTGRPAMQAQDRQEEPQKFLIWQTSEEWLEPASVGVLALKMSGDTVCSLNPQKMLLPASTMKSITTGAAMHSLGPDFRFETKIGYTGTIRDGILHGDLYIIGGGDPTLGSRGPVGIQIENIFARWKGFLSKAGISGIEGRIVGDDRYFDSYGEIGSWQWNDTGTYYGTGVSGLSFHENMQNINVAPGNAPGAPLRISIGYPELPWMEYSFPCRTGKAGSGNSLYLYTSPFAPVGEMRGTYAIDRRIKTEKVSNKFPAYTCAWHFMQYLKKCGLRCSGGAADLGRVFGIPETESVPQESLTVIGSTSSHEMYRIISETNHESNNLYAETLFKTLGKEYCGSGCYDSAYVAVNGILKELGTDPTKGISIADGSGLSRQNSISPEFMCGFLKAMMDSPYFEEYSESLPSPGEAGTLSFVMGKYPQPIKTRIRMKSGSMSGVQCYSGYVIPSSGSRDDTIVFAIMVNNYFGSPSALKAFLEKLIYLIASGN